MNIGDISENCEFRKEKMNEILNDALLAGCGMLIGFHLGWVWNKYQNKNE